MRIARLACVLLLIVLSASLLADPPPATSDSKNFTGLILRKWYDAAGRHTIEAELVDILEDKVKLKKPDGKAIEVPLSKLSPLDRSYVQWAAPLVQIVKAVPKRPATPKVMTNSIGMKLVLIPPGEFTMGEESRSIEVYPNRKLHRVRISKAFFMGTHEVTQADFKQVTGLEPSWFCAQGRGRKEVVGLDTSRFPVESVSWTAAVDFCNALSKKEGKTYRLPTEAEWEYACRAGTATRFMYGRGLTSADANIDGSRPIAGPKRPTLGRPTSIGSYRPNLFGLYDMHGNVCEWCSDWYEEEYSISGPVIDGILTDPQGPQTGEMRSLRSGSFRNEADLCTAATRFVFKKDETSFNSVGFRVVCER